MTAGQPIDLGVFVPINGVDQWLTLRGVDVRNPPLLIVGGPGAAFSRLAPFFAPWEASFTLVQWDQPGGGATWARNGDEGTGPLSLERLMADAIVVTQWVLSRLGAERLVLLGLSGGSILGLMMIRARPDMFSVYVSGGQVVNWARQEAMSYAMVLDRAHAEGDAAAINELEQLGPPPWPDTAADAVKSKYAGALTPAEREAFAALDPSVMAAVDAPPQGASWRPPGLEQPDGRARAMAAYDELRPEILAFDALTLGSNFQVPMIFIQGDQDAYTPTSLVQAYEEEIQAPLKTVAIIEGGGHAVVFMRDAFLSRLLADVRPLAADRRATRPRDPSP